MLTSAINKRTYKYKQRISKKKERKSSLKKDNRQKPTTTTIYQLET